jgi:ectoine hydroxylase-related dioxygenase (phytanoyl-CoA dioxygenase family)
LFEGLHLSVHEARRVQPELDAKVASGVYQENLKASERSHNLERRRFLPQRGDVLIWAALLAHGGTRISLERTRKSIVTHFCPEKIVPTYFERRPRQIVRHNEDVSYMSQHYEGSVGFVEEHVF